MMNKLKVQSAKRKIKTQNLKFLVLNFGFTLFALHFMLSIVFAQPVSSSELINNAKRDDGKTVLYAGEVIGDIMVRQAYAWLNVHDGKNAIGIWVNAALTKDIVYTGSYKAQGDWVEVAGPFHRACPQHGGDLDIHAERITVVRKGAALEHPLEEKKLKAGIILAAVALLLAIIHLMVRRFR